MDNDDKKLLYDTYDLVKENNEMLHKIRGIQKRQVFFQILHWLIVIGIAIGTLYFLEPYIEQFQQFTKEFILTIEKIKGIMPK